MKQVSYRPETCISPREQRQSTDWLTIREISLVLCVACCRCGLY